METFNSYFFEFIPKIIKDDSFDKSKLICHDVDSSERSQEFLNQNIELVQIKVDQSRLYWIICHYKNFIIPENEKRIALYEYETMKKSNIDLNQSLFHWNSIICFENNIIFQEEKCETLIINLVNSSQCFCSGKFTHFQENPFSKVLYGLNPEEGLFIWEENIPKLVLENNNINDFIFISPYTLTSLSYDCAILNKNNQLNLQNITNKELTLKIEDNLSGRIKLIPFNSNFVAYISISEKENIIVIWNIKSEPFKKQDWTFDNFYSIKCFQNIIMISDYHIDKSYFIKFSNDAFTTFFIENDTELYNSISGSVDPNYPSNCFIITQHSDIVKQKVQESIQNMNKLEDAKENLKPRKNSNFQLQANAKEFIPKSYKSPNIIDTIFEMKNQEIKLIKEPNSNSEKELIPSKINDPAIINQNIMDLMGLPPGKIVSHSPFQICNIQVENIVQKDIAIDPESQSLIETKIEEMINKFLKQFLNQIAEQSISQLFLRVDKTIDNTLQGFTEETTKRIEKKVLEYITQIFNAYESKMEIINQSMKEQYYSIMEKIIAPSFDKCCKDVIKEIGKSFKESLNSYKSKFDELIKELVKQSDFHQKQIINQIDSTSKISDSLEKIEKLRLSQSEGLKAEETKEKNRINELENIESEINKISLSNSSPNALLNLVQNNNIEIFLELKHQNKLPQEYIKNCIYSIISYYAKNIQAIDKKSIEFISSIIPLLSYRQNSEVQHIINLLLFMFKASPIFSQDLDKIIKSILNSQIQ